MKANYSKLFTKFAGIVGVTGVSLLITLPSEAKEALNPHPSIFSEATYNRSQGIQANSQSTPAELVLETQKGNTKPKPVVAQKGGRTVNPRPSIFNEPPYNRGTAPGKTRPITPSRPTKPATEVPTTPGTNKPATTAPTPTPPAAGTTSATKNLVALAESNGSFKTLIKALKAAGLAEVLQGQGPFTIFAPTDAAFAKLPQDALQDLLKPENKEVLVKVLTYHVVNGKVLSTDLKSGQVTSLQGDPITVKVDKATGVMVNDAQVTKADIQGSNGVIHQIDNLILPPSL
ncbi:secreted/surface protein with fasciclin-like repeats [Cylindrospermum stagnale PCC 7417]|uniref:Secreted/surface protein with fasciclin-like repeats n=1 Tax=Cylindrospermum stagnale PCC 7417 TaxID=56107 RepID=K9WS05_9NOST|nr:fasciclin domain-containing protein [Cylindrospermum stagnale]AFZ23160.1 secreted/surface protein with fasciclin-like repeats [Cylindrospermum stagnale PCC 7417]